MSDATSAPSTIPGELFLLLTTDSGRQDSTSYRRQALAGAAIAELVLREKIALTEGRNPKVQVRDTVPTDLPTLDQALGALADLDGKAVKSVIGHRSMDLTEVIGESFAADGVVQRKDGWFTTTWPTHDDTVETALRARLARAVREPQQASLQDGILLELLRGLGIAHRILKDDVPEMGRRDLEKAIAALKVESPEAKAVKRIIDEAMTAVIVATTAVSTTTITT
ncbi:GPP34 family phosphoprotein [Brachybacterium sp. Marseille-Q7125]|uniref:GOLPH3/VPS74 family protein n=1 Tax=Brachybacterium sp. Marseille-Q7125 TaxID=2932815 RepID=UPI001FF26313|nr:GPP34 family phosphoprotein [Brachybacterium sp. Marseille-Q7125]